MPPHWCNYVFIFARPFFFFGLRSDITVFRTFWMFSGAAQIGILQQIFDHVRSSHTIGKWLLSADTFLVNSFSTIFHLARYFFPLKSKASLKQTQIYRHLTFNISRSNILNRIPRNFHTDPLRRALHNQYSISRP